eukprot:scaffold242289_cov31-Tisochrysis_lutea.AAC.5
MLHTLASPSDAEATIASSPLIARARGSARCPAGVAHPPSTGAAVRAFTSTSHTAAELSRCTTSSCTLAAPRNARPRKLNE